MRISTNILLKFNLRKTVVKKITIILVIQSKYKNIGNDLFLKIR